MKSFKRRMTGKFYLFFLLLVCHACSALRTAPVFAETTMKEPEGDYVILLHGIAKTGQSMKKLEKLLDREGYEVINITYPSTDYDLQVLVNIVHDQIRVNVKDESKTLHFITHSMGGVVARWLLYQDRPAVLGRVVMLAPPSQGSEVTDFLKKYLNGPYQFFYGPAGQQLGTEGRIDMPVDYELGIIAGDRSLDPLSSLIIPGKDDGRVAVEKTKIKGMQDHITLHATHTFIMKNKEAMDQSLYFLKHGHFRRNPDRHDDLGEAIKEP